MEAEIYQARARLGLFNVTLQSPFTTWLWAQGEIRKERERMAKYRKKPVEIEAHRWFRNGDHPLDYSKDHDGLRDGELSVFTAAERKAKKWEGDVVRFFRDPGISGGKVCTHCGSTMHDHGWIDTLEGGHIVCPGDWIITGVAGEYYPCKPDIFAATYEASE